MDADGASLSLRYADQTISHLHHSLVSHARSAGHNLFIDEQHRLAQERSIALRSFAFEPGPHRRALKGVEGREKSSQQMGYSHWCHDGERA